MSARTRKMALAAYLVMICGFLASCGSNDAGSDLLAAYKNQKLQWQTCDGDFQKALGTHFAQYEQLGDRARCASMRAPLDYVDPAKGDVQIALLRVTAEDPQRRLGAIMFNPGGPGGDGLYAPVSDPNIKALYKQMSERYDLVGFSPRGVGVHRYNLPFGVLIHYSLENSVMEKPIDLQLLDEQLRLIAGLAFSGSDLLTFSVRRRLGFRTFAQTGCTRRLIPCFFHAVVFSC